MNKPNYYTKWVDPIVLMFNDKIVGWEIINHEVSRHSYVVLTMDREKLHIVDSRKLAEAANLLGRKVVFVPTLESVRQPEYRHSYDLRMLLNQVASHSQDDIKTAVLAGRGDILSTVDYMYAPLAFAHNQKVDGKIHHAEAVLAEFLNVIETEERELWWLMLLEPCYHCLLDMVASNAQVISYFEPHKPKWDTSEYLELKHSIQFSGRPVYTREIIVNPMSWE